MAAAFGQRENATRVGENHFKVEKEVVFSGGAVGKSGEVGAESSIEDLLSQNLVRVDKDLD